MRPATLYTLNATEILAGDYHRMIRSNLRPMFTANPNEAIAPMDCQHFAVPIHQVRRCIRPRTMPLHTDPWRHEYEDIFFGLEPALAEILEAPFQAKLDEARAKLAERIAAFNRLPWWRRVWVAFNRAV